MLFFIFLVSFCFYLTAFADDYVCETGFAKFQTAVPAPFVTEKIGQRVA